MPDPLVLIALLIAGAFLLGSVPFGFMIGRARGIDIRQHGSKNIGATNVGRVLGRKWGFACFGLDFLKGLVPVVFAGWWLGALARLDVPAGTAWAWLGVVVATILGHMFTPWLGFKGGKGVATGFGALAGVWPVLTAPVLVAFLVWVVCVKVTRYVGISSCLAAMSLPVSLVLELPVARAMGIVSGDAGGWPLWPYFITVTLLAGVVVIKHRGNIARTIAGTESRVGGGEGGEECGGRDAVSGRVISSQGFRALWGARDRRVR